MFLIFGFLIGGSFEIQFLAVLDVKRKSTVIHFEIETT